MSSFQIHNPEEIARLLAERIRAERLRREWKQETLAERSGVSLPTVRRYERTGRTSIGTARTASISMGAVRTKASPTNRLRRGTASLIMMKLIGFNMAHPSLLSRRNRHPATQGHYIREKGRVF